MENDLVQALLSNGPWAVMAGFLLLKILSAWEKDRSSRDTVLIEFKKGIDGLTEVVKDLKQAFERRTVP